MNFQVGRRKYILTVLLVKNIQNERYWQRYYGGQDGIDAETGSFSQGYQGFYSIQWVLTIVRRDEAAQ